MIDSIRKFLDGKKTYLVGSALILMAIVKYAGDGDFGAFVKGVLEGLAAFTIKAAIAKTAAPK